MNALTQLMRAAAIGHVEIVREIVEKQPVDIDERGPRGSTALMFAASGGHLDVVKVLIEHGADPSLREEGGWDVLRHASEDNDQEVVEFLATIEHSVRGPSHKM